MRAQIGWESGDQQRGEEESISPSRTITSPFQEITYRLVIYHISVRGRYSEDSDTSGASWKWGVCTYTKKMSTSVSTIPHCQGTCIKLLIHIYSAPSIGSACHRTDRTRGNEGGMRCMSKRRIYYLPCLSLCLKLYWGSERVYIMYVYWIEKTPMKLGNCGGWGMQYTA